MAWLVDLVFPRRCVACGGPADLLCPACHHRLRPLGVVCCRLCGAPTRWPVERCRECTGRRLAFDSARAAVVYDGPARALVAAWKERGVRRVTSLAAELVAAHVERPPADVIAYIPPDPARQLHRGAHPACALAVQLGARWQMELVPALARTRTSDRQAGLAFAERRRNVRGLFAAGALTGDPRVALVDDVYTTGASASAAAHALRKAGAREVHVVTLARTPR
jgi:predicted amidophosphoribosyltransferase